MKILQYILLHVLYYTPTSSQNLQSDRHWIQTPLLFCSHHATYIKQVASNRMQSNLIRPRSSFWNRGTRELGNYLLSLIKMLGCTYTTCWKIWYHSHITDEFVIPETKTLAFVRRMTYASTEYTGFSTPTYSCQINALLWGWKWIQQSRINHFIFSVMDLTQLAMEVHEGEYHWKE